MDYIDIIDIRLEMFKRKQDIRQYMRLEKIIAAILVSGAITAPQVYSQQPENPCPNCTPIDYLYKAELGEGGANVRVGDFGGELQYNPQELGTGLPKQSVQSSLSLGIGGLSITGFTNGARRKEEVKCYTNGKGYDLFVVEPPATGSNIDGEEIEVFAGIDRDPETTRWASLGRGQTDNKNKGYIPFEMGEIKQAYWVKVVDKKSGRSDMHPGYKGFDQSTVLLVNVCLEVASSPKRTYLLTSWYTKDKQP